MSHIRKFIVTNLPIRASIIVCPDAIDELCVSLRSSPLATMAVGRAAIGAGLLASQMKDCQIALQFRGDGPLGDVYAEAHYSGQMRGHAANPLSPNLFNNGELDVTSGIGSGILEVQSSHPGLVEPQTSTVQLGGRGIADDIAHYLHQSQQVLSVVALGMVLTPEGRVDGAGGIIIEVMQDASEEVLVQLENNVAAAGSFANHLRDGINVEGIVELYLAGLPVREVEHPHHLHYRCGCSMEKVLRAFTLLGKEELTSIIKEARDRKVTCEFCHTEYIVKLNELMSLLFAM